MITCWIGVRAFGRATALAAGSSEPAMLTAPRAPARLRAVRRVNRSLVISRLPSAPDRVDRIGGRGVRRMADDAEAVLEGPQQAVVVVDGAVETGPRELAHDRERDVPAARELLRASRPLVGGPLVEGDDQHPVGPEGRRVLDQRDLVGQE